MLLDKDIRICMETRHRGTLTETQIISLGHFSNLLTEYCLKKTLRFRFWHAGADLFVRARNTWLKIGHFGRE